ncbi:HEAT repeat domain-containing protein [Allorhodopirellula heiligendammensis]|uniref:PBS lyase HEAT-like repeat protein n=1 Tax=Allorhodopirellula heiligendammensis TaxID=2714739 RepID=A0A5C6BEE0_9BACT|nr:HEAT repeat domain-containing protein [Allorhodopirellula heiligendammensis]TWU10418.1 PBS lyase HEAT-like repeat protein [Allorhodopirellula heiligendammensis]
MKNMNLITQFPARVLSLIVIALAVVLPQRVLAIDPFAEYDMAMYQRPAFPPIQVDQVFSDGLLELWTKALNRPDVELQRMVIDSLSIAHQGGLPGADGLRPKLRELMTVPDQNLDLVRSAAHALIVLESKTDAALLGDTAILHGGTVAQMIEPALANWQSDAMKDVWLERLRSSISSPSSLLRAIHGLGELDATEAHDPLVELVKQRRTSMRIRLAAARALARLGSPELIELAAAIQSENSMTETLTAILAIELLQGETGDEAYPLLENLLDHPSVAVQSGALTQLLRMDPHRVDAHLSDYVNSRDPGIRLACARSMIATQKFERIRILAAMLDDENPMLRREVAAGLVKLGKQPDLHAEVCQRVADVLAKDSWRGCEQATVVLARMDYEPAGQRMVELLAHPRGEVKVATAWGLTQLRVTDLLPAMLDRAETVHEAFQSGDLNDSIPGLSDQVAHLFIAMGDQEYDAAAPLMRSYLPKNFALGQHSRAAAAWALGLIHENDPQHDLIAIMLERLNDTESLEPETAEVRQMCAVSIGRMNAESALPNLRENAGSEAAASRACDWAIERMTGEPVPVFTAHRSEVGGWFLSPIPDSSQ